MFIFKRYKPINNINSTNVIILFPVTHFILLLQIILSSQLMAVLITIIQCDARSTRVTAQYTVADDSENSQRTFRGKGIVEDAPIVDDGILTKYNSRPSRVSKGFNGIASN